MAAEQDEAAEGATKEGGAEGAEEMEEVEMEEEEVGGAKVEAPGKEDAAEADELMDFGKDEAAEDEEEEEPAPPAAPVEPEGDEVRDWEKLPPVKHEVAFETTDATPNVFGFGGVVLSSLCDGVFRQLLSGARANTGAKAGRHLFEVKVLERHKQVIPELRVGFSLAGSSLFLGDGSTEAVAFGGDGTYYLAEPGQLSSLTRANAGSPFGADSVIGILLNLDPASQAAYTVSLFLDGVRASQPQSVPAHLRGKALYPTVTFRGMAVAVNFGRSGAQLRALPFKCGMFAQLAEEHHERSSASLEQRAPALPAVPSGKGPNELVVVVGLPEGGVFDFASYFLQRNPAALEVSGKAYSDWCRRSGRRPLRDMGKLRSRDRPDLAFADPALGSRPWRRPLLTAAHLAGRSCVVAEVCGGLVRTEREELLSSAPASMRKVAIVVAGEPSDGFKAWVRDRIKADYETKKAVVEKRRMLAEAAGEKVPEEQLKLPAAPVLESVSFLPKEDASLPDMAEEDVARWHAKFSLPEEAEGFDEVRYEWLGKDAAQDLLHNWVLARKATFLVEGLTPGPWFKGKMDAWKQERTKIRQRHTEHHKKAKAANGDGANEEAEPTFDLKSIADIHDADGKGTPVYARFRYEDWLLLSWRYELHLLAHAFTEDVADPDIPGMPEDHVAHYFTLYFGSPFEPQRLGVDTLAEAMQLLREPLELVSRPSGGPGRILRSARPKDAGLDAFVVGVEVYRRDRIRRMEAGDESAQLVFPKANKPPAKACPGKAVPGKAVQKAAPPKDGGAKAPIAKRAPGGATQPPVARAPQAPGAKAPIAKTAPRGAVAPARPAGPGGVGGGAVRPPKAAPRGTVASTAFVPPGSVKRPAPPEGPPPDGLGPPPLKRPRPPSAPPPGPKAPIAKRKPA